MRVLHNVAGDDIAEAVEDTADQDDRTDRCGVYTDDVRIEEYEEGAEKFQTGRTVGICTKIAGMI